MQDGGGPVSWVEVRFIPQSNLKNVCYPHPLDVIAVSVEDIRT